MATRAIHIIWTTYMTWPPGDSRGHWSALFDTYGRLIETGHKLNLPDPVTLQRAKTLANEPPKVLTNNEIHVVANTIGDILHPDIAAGLPAVSINEPSDPANPVEPEEPGQGRGDVGRGGSPVCIAAAIEPTHVHLLFGPVAERIDRFVGRLKGRTSSAVGALPCNADRKRTWTAGYWKVFIFDDAVIPAVRQYIESHNLRRHLPASPYPWITPTPK